MTMKMPVAPKPRWNAGRHTGIASPYRFTIGAAGSWRIGFGPSSFLVAEGSGFSIAVGEKLFRDLEDDWHRRKKIRRPLRKRRSGSDG